MDTEQTSREAIETAAYRLFREIGYNLTSYTRIAEESGFGRPLVQYYFPKKADLATGFIFRVLGAIAAFVDASGFASKNPQGYVMQLGQVYYAFLLADDNMRRLTQDLFSTRLVTSKVIEANAAYTLPLVSDGGGEDDALVEASVKATGGVYELMFRGLDRGLALDPSELALQNVAGFMALSGQAAYGDTLAPLRHELLADDVVASIIPALMDAVFA